MSPNLSNPRQISVEQVLVLTDHPSRKLLAGHKIITIIDEQFSCRSDLAGNVFKNSGLNCLVE